MPKVLRNFIICNLIYGSIGFGPQAFGIIHCDNILQVLADFKGLDNGAITYNQSGGGARAQSYPLDFTLENLGLTEELLPTLGPNVSLIGEGYSRLYPVIKKIAGLKAKAFDPIYGLNPIPEGFMGDLLRQFLAENSNDELYACSSDHVPLPDGWANTTIGHMLLNNFSDDAGAWQPLAIDTVIEAMRVTGPGGKVIFASFNDEAETAALLEAVALKLNVTVDQLHAETKTWKHTVRYDDYGIYALDRKGKVIEDMPITRIVIHR